MNSPGFAALRSNGPNEPGFISSKADFRSVAEKSAWIEKHGGDAYERLPIRPSGQLDVATLTGEQYRRLPTSKKSMIIEQFGLDKVGEILAREG